MNSSKHLIYFLVLCAGLVPVSGVNAQDGAEESHGPRPGLSIGGRAAYYSPKSADHGDFAEGVQVRYHLTRRWALEGSVDLRQEKLGWTKMDVVPMQLSVMIYLMPHGYRFAPYILAGGGCYYTHAYTPVDNSKFRFGSHIGGGVEFFLNSMWSFGGSYRYLWIEAVNSRDAAHPLGHNFKDNGFMLTTAVNYSF